MPPRYCPCWRFSCLSGSTQQKRADAWGCGNSGKTAGICSILSSFLLFSIYDVKCTIRIRIKSRPLGGRRRLAAKRREEEGERAQRLDKQIFHRISQITKNNTVPTSSRYPFLPLRTLVGTLLPPRGRLFGARPNRFHILITKSRNLSRLLLLRYFPANLSTQWGRFLFAAEEIHLILPPFAF